MKELNETLENITSLIDAYSDTSINNGESLNEILKRLSNNLFYLEKFRADYKLKYESKIYELTKDKKMTVSRAVNIAEVEVKEMYLIRRISDAAYRNCDSIRTNISFLKNERNNSK
jgi:hypothetical protein